jgi:hypothetical protein
VVVSIYKNSWVPTMKAAVASGVDVPTASTPAKVEVAVEEVAMRLDSVRVLPMMPEPSTERATPGVTVPIPKRTLEESKWKPLLKERLPADVQKDSHSSNQANAK